MRTAPKMRNPAGQGEVREVEIQSSSYGDTSTERKLSRQALWRQRHPKAAWAHSCLASALRRGLIEKEPCEVCGSIDVDGHHDSYDRPMDVRWLCRRDHKAEHRRLKCEAAS